jgi:MFS family permease
LVVGAYGLSQLLVRIPLGFWSDRIGRRRPFVLAGVVLGALGCIGLVLSSDPWLLVASRCILGLSAATWVAYSVLFASYFPLNRSAHAMSLLAFAGGAAQAISGLAGGFLSQNFGTMTAFYVGIGLAMAGMLVLLPLKEEVRPRPSAMSVDRLGAIARNPALVTGSIIAIVVTFANFTIQQSFAPIYARQLGATDSLLGLINTAVVLGYTFSVLAGARVADAIGDRGVIALSLALIGLPILLTPLTNNLLLVTGLQVVVGIGRGISQPTTMSLAIRALPGHERASGMGIYQAVYSIGMFAGPPLGGAVADALGLPSVFVLTTAFCALGLVFALVAPALRRASVAAAQPSA